VEADQQTETESEASASESVANTVFETKDKDLETLNTIEEHRNLTAKEKAPTYVEPKASGVILYKVQKKDTLSSIAKKFSTDIVSLAELNQVKPPYALQIGQNLKVSKTPLVIQVLKKSSDPEALGGKKFYLKSDHSKEENEAKAAKPESEENENVKIEFAKNEATTLNGRTINKNRPAFLPVLFSSKKGNPEKSAGIITVDFDETLSHYADWAGVTVADILKVNKFSPNIKVKVNQKLKIPFTNKTPEEFTENRQEFHRAIQEDFYNNYRISRIAVRPIRKGETLYEICNGPFVVPFWLLSNYNPDKNIARLSEGQSIVVPTIVPNKPNDA
jgi:LysM repeat protein